MSDQAKFVDFGTDSHEERLTTASVKLPSQKALHMHLKESLKLIYVDDIPDFDYESSKLIQNKKLNLINQPKE
jgi:hypothetical protein